MLGLFFFCFCFVLFYFAFHDHIHFVRQRKKSLGRIQVFVSAEDVSTAFIKLNWSAKRLCFWLTVAESKSVNQHKYRRE